eukprot:6198474-Pleurochrysis_carterae.AAC.1
MARACESEKTVHARARASRAYTCVRPRAHACDHAEARAGARACGRAGARTCGLAGVRAHASATSHAPFERAQGRACARVYVCACAGRRSGIVAPQVESRGRCAGSACTWTRQSRC